MKKRILLLVIMTVFTIESFGASWLTYSSGEPQFSGSSFHKEQQMTESNQNRLINAQPPVKLDYSLEREQINKRTLLWNDKYKVAYLYVFSRGGGCIGFFTIKGKVSSVNSSVSNPEGVYEVDTYQGDNLAVVSSPAEDGSYGTNGDGIFAFTQSGIYMETNMEYLLVDQPLKIQAVSLGTVNR